MDIMQFMQPSPQMAKELHIKAAETEWLPASADGKAFIKILWTSPESGGWAVMHKWLKGYCAPTHKHLGAIHALVLSGKLAVRDQIMDAGDYLYEPNGVIHDRTEALEDTIHLNIADGPIVFFNDEGITHYASWEQMAGIGAAAGQ